MNGLKGGQGRSSEDVQGSAEALLYLAAAAAVALIIWGLS